MRRAKTRGAAGVRIAARGAPSRALRRHARTVARRLRPEVCARADFEPLAIH
jgi:hypothetical protein